MGLSVDYRQNKKSRGTKNSKVARRAMPPATVVYRLMVVPCGRLEPPMREEDGDE